MTGSKEAGDRLLKKIETGLEKKRDLHQVLSKNYEVDEKGEPVLDDNGKPIFKDIIELRLNGSEVKLAWECGKHLLEAGGVPEPEIDSVLHFMEVMANNHRSSRAKYTVQLPVNYVVGGWHIINSCRKFDLFSKQKDLSRRVDALSYRFASYRDAYVKVKKKEEALNTPPEDVKKDGKVLPLLKG